ncbi:MAG: hypothetical protein AAF754_06145 [Pseudomonadota bacterium]
MTEVIRDRLDLLASEVPAFVGHARVICATSASANAVLDELDCTVLPADLQFRSAGQHLTLRTSGRRLVQVTEASADLPFPQTHVGMPLAHNDVEFRTAIAKTLVAFTQTKRALQVVVRPLLDQSALSPSGQSLSVAALKVDLDRLDLTSSCDAPFLDKVARDARDITTAQIWLDGNRVVKTAGDVATISDLKTVVSTQLGAFRIVQVKHDTATDAARLAIFNDVIGPGVSLALISQATHIGLFALPGINVGALNRMFHAHLAQ